MQGYDTTVFNQWASRPADQRFDSLAALGAKVRNRQRNSLELSANVKELTAVPNDEGVHLTHPLVSEKLVPSHYGFTQFAQRISAPAKFLREKLSDDTELLATVVNHAIQNSDDDQTAKLLHTVDTDYDDVSVYRSATSQRYGRIWDAEVVSLAERIIDMSDGDFYSPFEWGKQSRALYASEHDVFMFFIDGGSLVDGGGERDQLYRGFYLWNSEVGAKVMGIKTFMFQVVCGNFQIWGQQDVNELRIRHNGGAPDRFAQDAWPTLRSIMESSTAGELDTIQKLKQIELPADPAKRLEFAQKPGKGLVFTRKEAQNAILLAEHEIGECKNVWQLMDGLTMFARNIPHIDTKNDLEERSGKLTRLVNGSGKLTRLVN